MHTSVATAAARRFGPIPEIFGWNLLTADSCLPLAYFPRLLHATPEQRSQFELNGGGTGIHWEEIDEDSSVGGLLLGIGDRKKTA